MTWKLMLVATSLALACQSKPELPERAQRLAGDRANPLIIFGNGAAAERLLRMRAGNGPPVVPSFGR